MKNRHYSILVFLISIFSIFSIDTCFAFDSSDYLLTANDVEEIMTSLKMTGFDTDAKKTNFRSIYNNWAEMTENADNFSFLHTSVLFFKIDNSNIGWTLNDNFTQYVSPPSGSGENRIYLSDCHSGDSPYSSYLRQFLNFYPSSGTIQGVDSSAKDTWYFTATANNLTWQKDFYKTIPMVTSNLGPVTITEDDSRGFIRYLLDFGTALVFSPAKSDFFIYGYSSNSYLYNKYYLTNYVTRTEPIVPTPTPTSSPTIVPTSTLDSIQTSINNIQDSLTTIPSSGDFNEFSSGDIINSLDLPPVLNPYSDFFGNLIDGLHDAFLDDSITTLTFPFLSNSFIIDASDWEIDYPNNIKIFLPIFWTVIISFAIMKMFSRMRIMMETGRHLSLASDLSKIDITDLF